MAWNVAVSTGACTIFVTRLAEPNDLRPPWSDLLRLLIQQPQHDFSSYLHPSALYQDIDALCVLEGYL